MIRFVDVHKSYRVDGRDIPALQPFSLEIADGEVFGIIGLSGAGKSTLIRLINLLERPSGGSIFINDVEMTALAEPALRAQRRKIGMIFQHFNLLASQTVADNVAFPMRLAGERDPAVLRARVDELLARVGLTAHANKYPSQLSGGQKQRVGIARALANRPSILLCDEATSALDPQTTASVLDLLAEINRELKLTIVLITHEMDVVRRVCDRVAVLDAGVIVERGAVADVFLHPQHATTKRFVNEALPEEAASELAPFAQVPGRILRLSFRGDTTLTPALGRVARETGIDFNILAGRIDRIKDLPYGQLTLAMQGAGVDTALVALREAGIEIEELSR
ncbi:methionine ABC transporter ATP-binding protein [Rhodanobacter sp. OK091]|uniref:methionine ABC transporter ATP-binding protein n=1 Tax=Rhodanobacter sp. OK091 TaxID=1881037 RepID=UPI000914A6B3|nr:methionine ABC transporter ATP-binding protein [Rhodanobacter sp. OK091]SHM32789.1 D-methionine transport system ATP-binding protein [Rhodanobacter sp. OK091]